MTDNIQTEETKGAAPSQGAAQGYNLLLSDSAAKRILAMREKEGDPSLMLRVTVLGGGCSGFQYELEIAHETNPDDVVFEKDGAQIVTDTTSLVYLNNAEIDFVQDMMKAAFKIHNPNAAAGCGCGKSFAVKG